MGKKFNYTGTCIPGKHYMVDTEAKVEQIRQMVNEGEYFAINRPRQYGKTTTLFLLDKRLESKDNRLIIRTSFAGIGDDAFTREKNFCRIFADILMEKLEIRDTGLAEIIAPLTGSCKDLRALSRLITQMVRKSSREVVLMIDEVDKSSNSQLFLSFLGMLRDKYLARNEGEDFSFLSVILAGVYDIKNIKNKLRKNEERKLNSPWNIAVDFNVDLSFSPEEIETMLTDYSKDKNISMDIPEIARRLHYFTGGYPFLVSKLCYIIDTYIKEENSISWQLEYVDRAAARILRENNTNFESLIANLENNPDLYTLVENILLNDFKVDFNENNPLINKGINYGIFRKTKKLQIQNPIYKELIYDYMISNLKIKELLSKNLDSYNFDSQFLLPGNRLDFEKILLRFQTFMKEQYSLKDKEFVERNWRLLFLAFIKPIINGHGFDFKEPQISEEKRLDVVITYYNKKYITELKIWDGVKKHEKGIDQLKDYLQRQDASKGYLVIFDFKKTMDYKKGKIEKDGREIFAVWV